MTMSTYYIQSMFKMLFFKIEIYISIVYFKTMLKYCHQYSVPKALFFNLEAHWA